MYEGMKGYPLLNVKLKSPINPNFSRTFFKRCESYSEALSTPPYEVEIETWDVHGKKYNIPAKGPGKEIVFHSYQQWIIPEQFPTPLECDPGFEKMFLKVTNSKATPVPQPCCEVPNIVEYFDKIRSDWQKTDLCQALVKHLEAYGPRMQTVKEIHCYGLGPLKLSDEDDLGQFGHHRKARNFLQHVAAMEIRDVLLQVQPSAGFIDSRDQSRKLPIYAQDPAYCESCESILANYEIEVVQTPKLFSVIDKDTFVVSKNPDVPVRQIVADITAREGGPAGMLCDRILDGGNMPDVFGPDPSSVRLYKYKTTNEDLELTMDDRAAVCWDECGTKRSGVVFHEAGLYLKKKPGAPTAAELPRVETSESSSSSPAGLETLPNMHFWGPYLVAQICRQEGPS